MAVTGFEEIAGKSGRSSGPDDSSLSRIFRVYTNTPFDTPASIQPSMPINYGDELNGDDSGLLCRSVSYEMQHKAPGRSIWKVTYLFQSNQVDQEKIERASKPNPLDRRAHITVRGIRYGELTNVDRNGDVMLTSAGETYPPIEGDAERWLIHVRKNYSEVPDWAWDYQRKINLDSVIVKGRELEALSLKFGDIIIPELQIENGHEFFPIEFDLEYNRKLWLLDRLDAGFYYIDSNGDYTAIPDETTGAEVRTEVLLDSAGGILKTTLGHTPVAGEEKYNRFFLYDTADFSILPLNE